MHLYMICLDCSEQTVQSLAALTYLCSTMRLVLATLKTRTEPDSKPQANT